MIAPSTLLRHCTCAAFLLATAVAQTPDPTPDRLAQARSQAIAGSRVGATQEADGAIRAEGPTWQARFEQNVARFEVEAGEDRTQIANLQLQFVGAQRGATWLPADADVVPALLGSTVRWRHDGVTASYALDSAGIEQSFVVDRRPVGTGDLVLGIGVSGNVQARATTATRHQPLDFRFADASAIRYGEAFAFDRTGARVEVATRYDGAGRIDLVVPAAFVDSAHYPLTIDPAIGAVLLPGGSADSDVTPDVAYDPELKHYLVVWQRTFAGSLAIRGAIYDDAGGVVNGNIDIASGAGAREPAVAFLRSLYANSFLVVWSQFGIIWGRIVLSSNGAMPAPVLGMSNPGPGQSDRRPSVSGPYGSVMVAWDRTNSGATQPQSILMRQLNWFDSGSATAVNQGSEHTLQTVGSGHVTNVRLARSNVALQIGGFTWYANRAVWQQFFTTPAPGDYDVRTMSFRFEPGTDSFVAIQGLSLVPGADTVGQDDSLPDIGSRASTYDSPTDLQYLVAWQDAGDVHGHMFDLVGPTGNDIAIRTTPALAGAPAVGVGSCEFTVGYVEETGAGPGDYDVWAARVLLDGTVGQNHSPIHQVSNYYQGQLRASSRPIPSTSGRQGNDSMLVWMAQTGPAGGTDDVVARIYRPVNPIVVFYGTPCPGPFGEMPHCGYVGGLPLPGNDAFSLVVVGAPAHSLAAMLVGTQQINVPIPGAPGCNLYTNLPFVMVLPAITDATGYAQVSLPIPCMMPTALPLAVQVGILTPGWNPFGWITSDDFDMYWYD